MHRGGLQAVIQGVFGAAKSCLREPPGRQEGEAPVVAGRGEEHYIWKVLSSLTSVLALSTFNLSEDEGYGRKGDIGR